MKEKLLAELKKAFLFCLNQFKTLSNQLHSFKQHLKKLIQNKDTQKKLKGFVALVVERWKVLTFSLFSILTIYYGVGALVSSHVNNSLDIEIQKTPRSTYTLNALSHSLKTQVDDVAWTPALPIIFPASILDNLPNFQIGVKNSIYYFIKKLTVLYKMEQLKEVAAMLAYPEDIWLFSQTKDDKFAPGSAKQYRKALAKINKIEIIPSTDTTTQKIELAFLLNAVNNLLEHQIKKLEKQVVEHHSEMLDFKADNIFYYTQEIGRAHV